MKIETHPHAPFVPKNMSVLIIGSFPGRSITLNTDETNNWFYAARRNQFWKIMEGVFQTTLHNTEEKKLLCASMHIGIADIILKAGRKSDSNQDQHLIVTEYNDKALAKILQQYPQVLLLFTSHFVEKHFRKLFPLKEHCQSLPSPSPRYARMSLAEKILRYRELLVS